jgi:hypothetical protein
VSAVALCGVVGATGGTAMAKTSDAGGGTKTAVREVTNVPILDRGPGANAPFAWTSPTFKIGKRYRKNLVGKVTLTLQVTGEAPFYLNQVLTSALISPQGRKVFVHSVSSLDAPSQSYGPLKQTPNSANEYCVSVEFCADNGDPDQNLHYPFVGTIGNPSLNDFYGAKMRGTWTLRILDFRNGNTGVLDRATLSVKPLRLKDPTIFG